MPSKKKRSTEPRWPHNRKTKAVRKQTPDDPQPRKPEGSKQRGGVQTADELKKPPMRAGKNGGMLRSGGTNKGGHGATPSVLRSRCRGALAKTKIFDLPMKIIRSKRASDKDKLVAWKALAQYGGLAALAITDADGNPIELPPFVVQMLEQSKETKS